MPVYRTPPEEDGDDDSRAPGYSNFDDRSPRMFVSPLRPACRRACWIAFSTMFSGDALAEERIPSDGYTRWVGWGGNGVWFGSCSSKAVAAEEHTFFFSFLAVVWARRLVEV